MASIGLIIVCLSAFIAVFFILSFLALIMRTIIILFPLKDSEEDSAIIAALSSVVKTVYPGTKITKIEVQK